MLFRTEAVITGCRCERRRFRESVGAAIPALLLALLPKCPICLAAWIAAGTGIGISAVAAGRLRVLVVILCLAPLVFVLIRTQANRRSNR